MDVEVSADLLEECQYWLDRAAERIPSEFLSSKESDELSNVRAEVYRSLADVEDEEKSRAGRAGGVLASQGGTFATQLDKDSEMLRVVNKTYFRMFSFDNLTADRLSLAIQGSEDGGLTWKDTGPAFHLDGGCMDTKTVWSDADLLRVVGGGVEAANGIEIYCARWYQESPCFWPSPI